MIKNQICFYTNSQLKNMNDMSKNEKVKIFLSAFENDIRESGLCNKSDILRQSHMIMVGLTSEERFNVSHAVNMLLNTCGFLHQTEVTLMEACDLIGKTDENIASYIQKKVSETLDGILLVEHANELSKSALDTIIQQIEDKKDQLLFILAGDSPKTNDFLSANPGIAHRMKFVDLDNPSGIRLSNMQTYQEKLANYVGWKGFKSFVHRLEIERDIENPYRLFAFVGNPGTGKTTAARLLGDVLFELGLIKTTKVVVCDCQDLISPYIGGTRKKTNEVVDTAIGGVLYLDDIHLLFQGSPSEFGFEAVETLLMRMEEERGKLIMIIAVDKEKKDGVLSINPGLSHRIQYSIEFEDFTPEELYQIMFVNTGRFSISPEVEKVIMDSITVKWQNRGKYFLNVRWAEQFAGSIVRNALKRNDVILNDENQMVITLDDVKKAKEKL